MAKNVAAQGLTLARFAMVSVFLSIGNTPALQIISHGQSTSVREPTLARGYVLAPQRAVIRQPGSRANNS